MNKKTIFIKSFLLTLLLGFSDPTMVMGADEVGSSMMMTNTSSQSNQFIDQQILGFLSAENQALSDNEFDRKFKNIFNNEKNLQLNFKVDLPRSIREDPLLFLPYKRILDAIKKNNDLSIITMIDIEKDDNICVEIFKGNSTQMSLDFNNQKYKNSKEISLYGSFLGLEKLTFSELNNLTVLNLNNLTSLKGVCINDNAVLKHLSIKNSTISDDLTLKNLPSLEQLLIIEDIISGNLTLENSPLKSVDIQKSTISGDLTLKNLPSLERLRIIKDTISGNLTLENLPSLEWLFIIKDTISGNLTLENSPLKIVDIEESTIPGDLTLKNLPSLERLRIIDNAQLAQVIANRDGNIQQFTRTAVEQIDDNGGENLEPFDTDVILDHLHPGIVQIQAITGEEAIVKKEGDLIKAYKSFIADPDNARFSELVPKEGDISAEEKDRFDKRFTDNAGKMFTFLQEFSRSNSNSPANQFKVEQALIGVQLLQGKILDHNSKPIPTYTGHPLRGVRHQIDRASYAVFQLGHNLPNTSQLFCLVYGIAQAKYDEMYSQKVKDFVITWISENFTKIKPIFKNDEGKEFAEAGFFLASDEGVKLTQDLTTHLEDFAELMQIFANKEQGCGVLNKAKNLGKILTASKITFGAQIKQDVFNPLIEALFMTMRGHNRILDNLDNLDNQDKENKPACTQGAYLHLLEALGEVTNNEHMQGAIARIEVVSCLPVQQ